MEKYEYEYMVTSIVIDKADEIAKVLTSRFNQEGYEGWELSTMELNATICIDNCIYDTLLWFNLYSCNIQKEVIGIMVSNDIELRMIAAQITMKASVGAEDLCSRYSSVSRMLGNMFNDVYYILQGVRYRYKYK